jgi:hypothetical protein
MMRFAITNPRLLVLIGLAECPEVGLRRDSSSAGRRFDPYTAHQILQQLTPLVASAGPTVCAMCAKFVPFVLAKRYLYR